jgi:phosphoribosylcarboxyaminoimidazole (NCAIR) mutase
MSNFPHHLRRTHRSSAMLFTCHREQKMKIAGWVLSGLIGLFLAIASAAPKFLGMDAALEPMEVVGWPVKYLVLLGAIEVGCVVLFLIPRTALLGAVLTTGLLGAALAANLRVDNPLFSHTLFSIYLGVAVWVALWLREEKVRAVFPLVR